ncbi:NAD-dependent dehydratase, partial [Mesorhizobium sp. M7A.F.Ca.CA.001.04.1.1]
EQLYHAYRKSNVTLDEFEGPRFQRIGHIRYLLANGLLDGRMRVAEASKRLEVAAG